MADVSGGRSTPTPNRTHDNMCAVGSSGSCFVPWCTCPCHAARPPVGDTTSPNRCTCNPPDDHDEYCPLHGRQHTGARYRVADAIRYEVRTQLGLRTGDYLPVHWESVADAALAALDHDDAPEDDERTHIGPWT